jgi:CPW-WPC domain-containing protein
MPCKLRMLLFCLPAVAATEGEDTAFPAGVRPVLDRLAALSGKYGSDSDDQTTVQQLQQANQVKLNSAVEDQQQQVALAKAAYAKVSERVVRMKFVGGCPREFEGCPRAWEEKGGACHPPADYEGTCGVFGLPDFEGKSVEDKEAFAAECRLSWPCVAACALDFSACPRTWQSSGGSCIAPGDYQGICSTTTDFAGYSQSQKAEWASMCGATWPCAKAGLAARAVGFLAARSMPIDGYKIRNSLSLTEALRAPAPASVNVIMHEDVASMQQASKYRGMEEQAQRLEQQIEDTLSLMESGAA